ncbi:MAG: MerR family transcriptional regulator [Thermoanaerobaculia bacterium]
MANVANRLNSSKDSTALRIGELARRCGVSPDTIRYYEREGILPRPRRSPARQRIYDDMTMDALEFVRQCQRFGLSLEDIRVIRDVRNESASVACRRIAERLELRLKMVDKDLAKLRGRRRKLAEGLRLCSGAASQLCPLLSWLERLRNERAGIAGNRARR